MGVTAPTLFTAGYEGLVQAQLLDLLTAVRVTTLLDVRAVPNSRKPGFSKRILGSSVEALGITYLHLQALGTPMAGRQAARAGRADEMAAIFNTHMATQPAQAALEEAIVLSVGSPTCLLCFERDPHFCHRRIVAEAVCARTGLAIIHL